MLKIHNLIFNNFSRKWDLWWKISYSDNTKSIKQNSLGKVDFCNHCNTVSSENVEDNFWEVRKIWAEKRLSAPFRKDQVLLKFAFLSTEQKHTELSCAESTTLPETSKGKAEKGTLTALLLITFGHVYGTLKSVVKVMAFRPDMPLRHLTLVWLILAPTAETLTHTSHNHPTRCGGGSLRVSVPSMEDWSRSVTRLLKAGQRSKARARTSPAQHSAIPAGSFHITVCFCHTWGRC